MNQHAYHALGIRTPIIQAPMSGTSTPELAAAVSNAGGLGSIGLAANNVDTAREAIARTRSLTSAPFNVNFFCHQAPSADPVIESVWLNYLNPLFNDFDTTPPSSISEPYISFKDNVPMQDMVLQEKPSVVSFHFGLPSTELIQKLKEAGITLLATATTLGEAQNIESAGIDFIVAQGVEAGGHRGVFDPHNNDEGLTTLALVQLLTEHIKLPVIAAGGIMNGRGIRAAIELGACAAQMGTAFILCPESAANDVYRNVLASDKSLRTRITAVASGRPARGIVNALHTRIDKPGRPTLPAFPICYTATKALQQAAAARQNIDFGSHWAGQGAPLARAMPAAELVETLMQEISA